MHEFEISRGDTFVTIIKVDYDDVERAAVSREALEVSKFVLVIAVSDSLVISLALDACTAAKRRTNSDQFDLQLNWIGV